MAYDAASDEDLLAATPRHPEAFGAFYARYEDAVLLFFLRRVRGPGLAADLAAETFAAALASVRRFRAERGAAAAWLFGIARNTLAVSRRRGRVEARARRRLGIDGPSLDDEALERVAALENGGELVDRLHALPEEQRAAVAARILAERAYADIARELRCSEVVARKRVSRGLAALRAATRREGA